MTLLFPLMLMAPHAITDPLSSTDWMQPSANLSFTRRYTLFLLSYFSLGKDNSFEKKDIGPLLLCVSSITCSQGKSCSVMPVRQSAFLCWPSAKQTVTFKAPGMVCLLTLRYHSRAVLDASFEPVS